MPMTGVGMADAIKTKLNSSVSPAPAPADLDPFCQAIGEAIVEYIVANGLVIIPLNAIATVGGPAAQSGPTAPVPLSIT